MKIVPKPVAARAAHPASGDRLRGAATDSSRPTMT
jgi:hypothetical protein